MSLEINDVDDLQKLLKKLDLKVQNLDELKSLLVAVQTPKNPEQARLETIKNIGVTVPCTAVGVAFGASFFLFFFGAWGGTVGLVVGLAAIWGAVALVSIPAVLGAMILLRSRPAPPAVSSPPATAPSLGAGERPSEFVIAGKEL
jgi:hypothetical protein